MSRAHALILAPLLLAACGGAPTPPPPRDTAETPPAAPMAGPVTGPGAPDGGRWVAADFEDHLHEQPLALPFRRNGLTFNVQGGAPPRVVDVTRRMVVHGPRSMGLPTMREGAMLSVMADRPAKAIWVSLIRDGAPSVEIERIGADGQTTTATLSFTQAEPEGAYRTFVLDGRQSALRGVRFRSGGMVLARAAAVLE